MKHKSISKKLVLNKKNISNFAATEMHQLKGGYYTDYDSCWTRYREQCMSFDPNYCPPTGYPGCV